MVYGMTWRVVAYIWYGLAGKALYMVWPGVHDIVHGYGLTGMAWYMLWPGGYGMVCGMVWRE